MADKWAKLTAICNHNNMIDTAMVVSECKKNPEKECNHLKKICHHALAQGQKNVKAKNMSEARSNFVLAYQARCICDYIWVHIMDNGDAIHADFLQKSRDFVAFCTGSLSGEDKDEALKMIQGLKN